MASGTLKDWERGAKAACEELFMLSTRPKPKPRVRKAPGATRGQLAFLPLKTRLSVLYDEGLLPRKQWVFYRSLLRHGWRPDHAIASAKAFYPPVKR
jgi:hypothetical protein